MIHKNFIQQEIVSLKTLEEITRSYSQIASMRMKRVRDSVLSSRSFLDEISFVFAEVLVSYRREMERISRSRRDHSITFISHNGRTVAVFISANTGLYGDLIQRTFNLFLDQVRNSDCEATIVGKLGLSLFKKALPNHPYTFFDLDDVSVEHSDMTAMVRHLVQYEKINIYYSQFKNAVRQEPSVLKLSAGSALPEKQKEVGKTNYWFEPSLESILVFFETEIFGSLLGQTVSESQLAKFASRIVSLDSAGEKIRIRNKEMFSAKLKLMHVSANRKQQHSLAGMSLWKGGLLYERSQY